MEARRDAVSGALDPAGADEGDRAAGLMRLDRDWLERAPDGIQCPGYDLDAVRTGIVHFGPGAFHRAHQAWFIDDLLARDPRWGICAVSLRSPGVRDALQPQQGLYSVAVLDAQPRTRVIGALRELLVAPESGSLVLRRLAARDTRIVSATVTEKGYCLNAGGALDLAHPDIQHDLARPQSPRSLVGYLVEGLRLRRAAGLAPFTAISCDNLADNGHKLARAVVRLAAANDAALARWIEAEVAFPRTMVDSIVPATDAALRARVSLELGAIDRWPVRREAWAQWVIEDRFCNDRPDWASVGVTVSDEVERYANAKLRVLNGLHSTLAYLGLGAARATVADAMRDPGLLRHAQALLAQEILPNVEAPAGFELARYGEAVLQRFRNEAIQHELAQIAWDGSQKLPIRIMGTIGDALEADRPIERLCLTLAAWLHFVRREAQAGRRVVDPLAETLFQLGAACANESLSDLPRWFAHSGVFPQALRDDARFRNAMARAYDRLGTSPLL